MGYVYVNPIFVLIYLTFSLVTFVSFLISPFVAWRKGYAPYYWLFACGPVGLGVISFLRPLKAATTPEQYEQMEARANLIGSILSGIAIFLSVGLIASAFV
jgi:hypothetical protein